MWGHATIEEKEIIQELEKKIDVNLSSIGQLIGLSILYIEPCHNYESAIELLKSVMKRNPDNEKAKILMAYCCIHYLMDESDLLYAEKMLNEIIQKGKKEKGAAYWMLPEVLHDLGKIMPEEEINFLQNSIKFEPSWVSNHYYLSKTYEKLGNLEKAIEHMHTAIANIVNNEKKWELVQYYYESLISGRVSSKKDLELDLKKMIEKSQKKKWAIFKRKKK